MPPGSNHTPALITRAAELAALVKRARKMKRVAVDTEAASFHRYFDRVFLVQISTDEESAIIDPLEAGDLAPLGDLLADPRVELVFHDADFDIRSLNRDYGFEARTLFDTRIAAQLLSEPGIGLGALLEVHFGVRLNKKFQRADWSHRPLTREMLDYAADDTRYLLRLRDMMEQKLEATGRLSWAREEFQRLEAIRWSPPSDDIPEYLSLKGARAMSKPSLLVLRELVDWRDREAQQRDRPTFRIMSNQALLAIAEKLPRDVPALVAAGVPGSLAQRYAEPLIRAIEKGIATPVSSLQLPRREPRPKPDHAADARFNRLKKLRDDAARAAGLQPGVACPNAALQAIARAAPRTRDELLSIPDLRRWQIELLDIEKVLEAVGG